MTNLGKNTCLIAITAIIDYEVENKLLISASKNEFLKRAKQ